MATTGKRDLQKKKEQKKKDKLKRKEERKANASGDFDDMIAYVDENGNLTDTPPDPAAKKQNIDVETIQVSVPRREEEEEPDLIGCVEYFNSDKGYGFIKDLNNKNQYFFHISNAPESITEGNQVTFELERGQKGFNAVNIQLVKQSNNK